MLIFTNSSHLCVVVIVVVYCSQISKDLCDKVCEYLTDRERDCVLMEVSTRPIPIFEKIGFSLECVYVYTITCILHYSKDHLEPILLATVEYCKHDDLTRMDPLLGEAFGELHLICPPFSFSVLLSVVMSQF